MLPFGIVDLIDLEGPFSFCALIGSSYDCDMGAEGEVMRITHEDFGFGSKTDLLKLFKGYEGKSAGELVARRKVV